jgi:3,4-dihydroxy 2-butanone 4-phosphate synthase/GTP cyclohydrolase II
MMPEAPFPEPLAKTLTGMDEHYMQTGLPWVTLAYAQSLDGSIATQRGNPLVISNDASLMLTHQLRARHDAILIGIGTLLADDPRLNVRLVLGDDPQPVVLDNNLRTPLDARLLSQRSTPAWIMTSHQASSQRREKLSKVGVRIFHPSPGQVKLLDTLRVLGQEGIRSVMVEGGAQVITAFLQTRLVNCVVITISPLMVGGLHAIEEPLLGDPGSLKSPNHFPYIDNLGVHRLEEDLLVWGRPQWSHPMEV